MLLTVDVGNTNITLGLFKEDKVFATFRMNTQMVKTSDEYGSTIAELIARILILTRLRMLLFHR